VVSPHWQPAFTEAVAEALRLLDWDPQPRLWRGRLWLALTYREWTPGEGIPEVSSLSAPEGLMVTRIEK